MSNTHTNTMDIADLIEEFDIEQAADDADFASNSAPLTEYGTDESSPFDVAMERAGLSINTTVDAFVKGNGKSYYIT